MPLRDGLLTPIEGSNPSGVNLYYDRVFDQVKEARQEDEDLGPAGDWGHAPKRADRNLVIKVAGDALATRSKDLRLAGWYLESLIRKEGFAALAPGLAYLRQLQAEFWDTLYPELDEDGLPDLRIGAVETACALLATQIRRLPLTRSGMDWIAVQDARAVGFETEGMSDDRAAARADAISRGRLTGEDLQKAVDSTPKAFYIAIEGALAASKEALDELDRYSEERYGDDYPNVGKLKAALTDIGKAVAPILTEKRRLEPDEVEADEVQVDAGDEPVRDEFAVPQDEAQATPSSAIPAAAAPRKKAVPAGAPSDPESAFAQVAACAEFLRQQEIGSPVPYLLCTGLRLGELRLRDGDSGEMVAPPTETRQQLRRLLSDCDWEPLMALALATLAEPCGRAWLDVHRYIARAADANGWSALRAAVSSTVAGLLRDLPTLRQATLDDDTPCGNAETQQWIDAEVLPPAAVPEAVAEPDPEPAWQGSAEETLLTGELVAEQACVPAPGIYELAVASLRQGRAPDAVKILEEDAAMQPSGRMRFQRRVQVAEMCLLAEQQQIALPILSELAAEIARRNLESWESAAMLAQPLSLLLRAMESRKTPQEDRDEVFARLCRLHPQAALAARR